MNDPQEFDHIYFPGLENRLTRYYYYLNQGLTILNNFRNLFLGIIGVYIALKLDNWALLIAMFIPSAILLTVVGYFATHRVNKIMEWLSLRFGTHYGIQQFNYAQGTYETLQEIRDELHERGNL